MSKSITYLKGRYFIHVHVAVKHFHVSGNGLLEPCGENPSPLFFSPSILSTAPLKQMVPAHCIKDYKCLATLAASLGSVHHFGLDGNISVGWLVMKYHTDIHDPLRMNYNDFGNPLTFVLTSTIVRSKFSFYNIKHFQKCPSASALLLFSIVNIIPAKLHVKGIVSHFFFLASLRKHLVQSTAVLTFDCWRQCWVKMSLGLNTTDSYICT